MECPACKQPLMVAGSRFFSEAGSTEVYHEMTLVCVNPKCGNFCGHDLNDPAKVVEIVQNKVRKARRPGAPFRILLRPSGTPLFPFRPALFPPAEGRLGETLRSPDRGNLENHGLIGRDHNLAVVIADLGGIRGDDS